METKMMKGICAKCHKPVVMGDDGFCRNCGSELCWDCWVAEGHECPICGDYAGKRTARQEDEGL